MFSSNWRDPRIKSFYSKFTIKELIQLSRICKNAYQEVWAYLSVLENLLSTLNISSHLHMQKFITQPISQLKLTHDAHEAVLEHLFTPENLLRLLNESSSLEIKKLIAEFFQPESKYFQALKQSVSIPNLVLQTGNHAIKAPEDALGCYLVIADTNSLEFNSVNTSNALISTRQKKLQNVSDSIKIIANAIQQATQILRKEIYIKDGTYVNLSNTQLDNASFYALRENKDTHHPDLTNANFKNASLENAYLKTANLTGANFENANLKKAYLKNANLTNANLIGANLTNAILINTNIIGANFTNANLTRTNFFCRGETINEPSLNDQLNFWETQLSNHPHKDIIKNAMVNDLIYIIKNNLLYKQGAPAQFHEKNNFLETACKHSLFNSDEKTPIHHNIKLACKLFSVSQHANPNMQESDFQDKLKNAILELKQSELPKQHRQDRITLN